MTKPTTAKGANHAGDWARMWCRRALPGATLMHAHYRRQRFRRHSHRVFTVCGLQEGLAGIEVSREQRRIPAGSFSLIAPGEIHTGECLSDELEYRTVYLERDAAEQLMGLEPGRRVTVGIADPKPHDPALVADFLTLHERLEAGSGETATEMREILTEILIRYAQPIPRAGIEAVPRSAVAEALDHLHSHFHLAVSLDELAERAGLSRYHFLRVFRAQIGLPPHAYLIQYRVERAKRLLIGGEKIADVALCVGFSDQSHFGGHFKSIVGMSPGQFVGSVRTAACCA